MRPGGRPHFALFGIPVRVEPMFWFITLLLGFTPWITPGLLIGWVVIVFSSVLVHELGHAVAFRAFGSQPTVVLHGFGGVTFGRPVEGRWPTIVVSLAGPLTGLVLLGLPSLLVAESTWAQENEARDVLAHMGVWVNVWWSLVNLAPLLPLDGGHVTEQLVGPRTARVVTIVVAIPLAIFAIANDIVFGGVIAGFLAWQAWRELQAGGRRGAPQPGLGRVTLLRPPSPPRGPSARAPEYGDPWTALAAGDPDAARALAASAKDPWLDGAIEVASGAVLPGLRLLEQAFLDGPPSHPEVVEVVAEADLGPRLAERLLEGAGDRPPVAVAELVRALTAAGWHGQAAMVSERLAADPRADQAWAMEAAAAAWDAVGERDRAERWRRRAGGD